MNCWSVLELDRNADERSIKRQYARLLKVNRPDEDPDAFQRLRDAYEQALDQARNRYEADEDEYQEIDASPEPFMPVLLLETVLASEPTVVSTPPPVEQSWYEVAHRTTAQNLHSQHQLARDLGADAQFQQHLVQRCLIDTDDNLQLLKAAVAQLQWLTPWQKVTLSAHQEKRLTQALLDETLPRLQALLESQQERQFLDELKALEQQPWLEKLEHREHLQRWTMTLLINTRDWTPALFERICQLFDWDQKHYTPTDPPSLWQRLVERCERYGFAKRLEELLTENSHHGDAAKLLLEPPPLDRQLRMARNSDPAVWEGCEQLSEDLTYRYPEALKQYPDADLTSWRKLYDQVHFNAYLRAYLFGFVFILTAGIVPTSRAGKFDLFYTIFTALSLPVVILLVFYVFMSFWKPVSASFASVDEYLSERLLPRWLSWPGHQALLLRHGIPLGVAIAAFSNSGPVAVATCLIMLVAWIVLSPYRISRFQSHCAEKTGGWQHVKRYCSENIGKGVMIILGLMFAFVLAVLIFGPGHPR
ncbi:J domain-containing protein [Pseudomonas cichorii]|uniref:J domain-containing protein n=1 Tax=Pseudomonas cichorii TaxID=36746 RepID=UPI001C8A8460|nr:J domain-containing protein [Pseudomonas cichorii]MBX8529787.1 J domain-containing protein [Pseudomonas cichorii]